MSTTAPSGGLLARIGRLDDGLLIRAVFFGLLAGTAGVMAVDFLELSDSAAGLPAMSAPAMPVLPFLDPEDAGHGGGPAITTDAGVLAAPLTVTLGKGGVLQLTGTIDPGSFERVASEVAARGEYVQRVALDSPGGSVEDALKIGALFLSEGFTTSVAAGALCASSCPLILAGGRERIASARAAIGLHQIYAALPEGQATLGLRATGETIASAQRTTAAITRYLGTTGVDPALWLHALDTPPDRLYFLSPEEMRHYELATRLEEFAAGLETVTNTP